MMVLGRDWKNWMHDIIDSISIAISTHHLAHFSEKKILVFNRKPLQGLKAKLTDYLSDRNFSKINCCEKLHMFHSGQNSIAT